MSRKRFLVEAGLLCLALILGAADCLAQTSYSTVSGNLHVAGVYVPGYTVYDAKLSKSGGDFSELVEGDMFILQHSEQSFARTPVPSIFSLDTAVVRMPVVAVTDGSKVTQYLEVEMMYQAGSAPMRFTVTRVLPADLGRGATGPTASTGVGIGISSAVHGSVNWTGAMLRGIGFTISHGSTGVYTIHFATPFPGIPDCTVTALDNWVVCSSPYDPTTSGFSTTCTWDGDVSNADFTFTCLY